MAATNFVEFKDHRGKRVMVNMAYVVSVNHTDRDGDILITTTGGSLLVSASYEDVIRWLSGSPMEKCNLGTKEGAEKWDQAHPTARFRSDDGRYYYVNRVIDREARAELSADRS